MGVLNVGVSLAAFAAGAAGGLWLSVAQPREQGAFTAQQADAGRYAYQSRCSTCHTADLGGTSEVPALAGEDFLRTWGPRTTADLVRFIRAGMPPEGPSLTSDEALHIVSYVLQRNGAVSGSQPLTESTAVPIGSIATGRAKTPPGLELARF